MFFWVGRFELRNAIWKLRKYSTNHEPELRGIYIVFLVKLKYEIVIGMKA